MATNSTLRVATAEIPLSWYIEHAPELAQRVVDFWGPYASTGHEDVLPLEFMGLVGKAFRFRTEKAQADNGREFNSLTPQVEAAEKEAQLAFAEAYKALDDSAAANLSQWDKAVLDVWRAMKS